MSSEIEKFIRERLRIRIDAGPARQEYGSRRDTQTLTVELVLTPEDDPDAIYSGEVIASHSTEVDA